MMPVLTLLSIVALILMTAVAPMAIPTYTTLNVPIQSADYAIYIGDKKYGFFTIPHVVAVVTAVTIVAVAAYLELVARLRFGLLPKLLALAAVAYTLPLPYVLLIQDETAVVVSNYARYLSVPTSALALVLAVVEGYFSSHRTKLIADISTTEDRTRKT